MAKNSIYSRKRLRLIANISVACMVIAVVGGVVSFTNSKYGPGNTKPATSSAASCIVSTILVNSCRPWLGAAVNDYPPGTPGSLKTEITNHESRIGRQLDVVHDYRTHGQNTMSADDVYYANRANTILMMNWKPAEPWSKGNGSDATVNSQIDAMANSIKALGSTKIFLSIYHEPENNVNQASSACGDIGIPKDGAQGTTTDYVNMWHNTRARFNKLGVTNVVWVMNYMGFSKWNCMVGQLYPGDSYVDWITWDPYTPAGGSTFNASLGVLYDYLTKNSKGYNPSSPNDYLSKPWGLNEWGVDYPNASQTYQAYADAKADIDNNTFPKLKLWDVWDNLGSKIYYTPSNAPDPAEQQAYNTFANDPHFTNTIITNPVPGDTNADGFINSKDIANLVKHWGQTVSKGTNGDLSGNDKVDTADIIILVHYWGG